MTTDVVVKIGLAVTGGDTSDCDIVLTARDCGLTQDQLDQYAVENPELVEKSVTVKVAARETDA